MLFASRREGMLRSEGQACSEGGGSTTPEVALLDPTSAGWTLICSVAIGGAARWGARLGPSVGKFWKRHQARAPPKLREPPAQ